MIPVKKTSKRILLHLLKDFSSPHTITALAQELGLTRVGIWKNLKRLESEAYITLNAMGGGSTSTFLIALHWENPLVEKTLSLFLMEEAREQRRWLVNFSEIEAVVDFAILYGSILHSPKEAGDIDLLGVAPKKNVVKIQAILDTIQKTQSKKIHSITFTKEEFKAELKTPNKAFIDAIKKGVILFGQENFIAFMKEMAK